MQIFFFHANLFMQIFHANLSRPKSNAFLVHLYLVRGREVLSAKIGKPRELQNKKLSTFCNTQKLTSAGYKHL